MENIAKNYLGIDWGTAKVGVALGHHETGLALAYGTFPNDEFLWDEIGKILLEEEIGTVVIGLPKHALKESYPEKEFGKTLGEKFSVTIVYQDEMFTSKMAQATLLERGEKHVSATDDAESARIILESYLDHQKRD